MKRYEKITAARKLLDLPERATMDHIKANYRRLIQEWHPDKSRDNTKEGTEMAAKIAEAYKIIMGYCNHYEFSFSEEEVRHHLSGEEWMSERFAKDPFWVR
jgi:DnaJ-class molecular chaperone